MVLEQYLVSINILNNSNNGITLYYLVMKVHIINNDNIVTRYKFRVRVYKSNQYTSRVFVTLLK